MAKTLKQNNYNVRTPGATQTETEVAFLLVYNMLVISISLARLGQNRLIYTNIIKLINSFMKFLSIGLRR